MFDFLWSTWTYTIFGKHRAAKRKSATTHPILQCYPKWTQALCPHGKQCWQSSPTGVADTWATIQSSSCVTKDLSGPPFNSFLEQVIWLRKDILNFIPLERSLFISKPWETSESAVILWWRNFEKNSKAWCCDATVTCNNRKRLQD